MSWSNNNRAHTSLWFFEKWHLQQKTVLFNDAGDWDTGFLIKASANDTDDMIAKKARAHAQMLDDVFTSLYRARYEKGVSKKNAIDNMTAVLRDQSKKMKELGDAVDHSYKFLGEV